MAAIPEVLSRLQSALGRRTLIMGVLNLTPDSFYDGGRYTTLESALAHAEQMIADGADILDIGGESTRPGADPVPLQEEIQRT
ncbi:MAG: dihydropteroate synthase, partial [Fimbriimonadales bacterium]|nr:dihydropteroate synthase [Fimbriimonadales bacterium]